MRARQVGLGLAHGGQQILLRLGVAVVDHFQRSAHDRPGHIEAGIRVREDHTADTDVRHEEEIALVAEHRAAVAEDANALHVLEPEPHAVPRLFAGPHLRDAPCEEILLGDERRAIGEPAACELEAHIARVVAHARPCAAGRADGNDRAVQRHVDGHVP